MKQTMERIQKTAGSQPAYQSIIYGKDTTVFCLLQQKVDFMKDKKRLATILGGLSILFLFAGCVEGLDGGITLWNLISLMVAFALGWASKKLDDSIEVK